MQERFFRSSCLQALALVLDLPQAFLSLLAASFLMDGLLGNGEGLIFESGIMILAFVDVILIFVDIFKKLILVPRKDILACFCMQDLFGSRLCTSYYCTTKMRI